MLTFTYSLVTLSIEQKKARNILTAVQQYFQNCLKDPQSHDRNNFENALSRLIRLDESSHRRNVELYVIPAIQKASHEADMLLDELEALSLRSTLILQSVREKMHPAFDQDKSKVQELCEAMNAYCQDLLLRLTKEEEELFPIARRVISSEGWFDLASKFISHGEAMNAGRSSPSQVRHAPESASAFQDSNATLH